MDKQIILDAHQYNYDRAFAEIKEGKKKSHWMWYIFPQPYGLGRSEMSRKYALKSIDEALDYVNDEILGQRLKDITTAFYQIKNKSATDILGSPDDLKMKSCMTLFHLIQSEEDIFHKVLEKYYDGHLCEHTRKLVNMGGDWSGI